MDKEQSTVKKDHFVEVSVVTTSGSYPSQGFEQAPTHQKVKIILDAAAKHLRIVDTSGWVATANSKEIKIDLSFAENGLAGQVQIDFGPREGGGGNASVGF